MTQLSKFEAQSQQLDGVFDKLLAGQVDASIASSAASVINAKVRLAELELKRAVKGNFVSELVPRWKAEHVAGSQP